MAEFISRTEAAHGRLNQIEILLNEAMEEFRQNINIAGSLRNFQNKLKGGREQERRYLKGNSISVNYKDH